MNKRCVPCQRNNLSETHKFCSRCGKELTNEISCQCGYVLSFFEKYCPICGKLSPEHKES